MLHSAFYHCAFAFIPIAFRFDLLYFIADILIVCHAVRMTLSTPILWQTHADVAHTISLEHIFHCGELNLSLALVCVGMHLCRECDDCVCVCYSFHFSLQLYDVICHFMVFVCFQLQIEKFSSLDVVFASNFPLKTLNVCNMQPAHNSKA